MGISFRPPDHATLALLEQDRPSPAPLEETLRAMIVQAMSVGTFQGSLDYDALFHTSFGQENAQIAMNLINDVSCVLEDNSASLTAPQMTPGKMVRQFLDPVLADLFKICPVWHLDQITRNQWHGRIDLLGGLSVIVRCTPLAMAATVPPAAHVTFDIVAVN